MRTRREGGAVLIFVLIVMAIMMLAGAGVMRAADTANVLAGNFAFQQAAMQASDRAITDALAVTATRVASGGGNTAVANQYLASIDAVDSRGMPSSINWAAVSCQDQAGAPVPDCAADTGNYRVQYAVERMCSASPDLSNIADIRGKCAHDASATAVSASSIAVHYRVLVRVRGPRGTESWFEAMVSGPAST
jgi:type IV pilus assembly protein PilX